MRKTYHLKVNTNRTNVNKWLKDPQLVDWLKRAIPYSTIDEIAEGFWRFTKQEIDHHTAAALARRFGGEPPRRLPYSKKTQKVMEDRVKVDHIVRLAAAGKNRQEIGAILGIHCTTLGKLIKRHRIKIGE